MHYKVSGSARSSIQVKVDSEAADDVDVVNASQAQAARAIGNPVGVSQRNAVQLPGTSRIVVNHPAVGQAYIGIYIRIQIWVAMVLLPQR